MLNIATKILNSFIKEYKSEQHYNELEGKVLSMEQTELFFEEYIGALGIGEWLSLNFTPNAVRS